MLGFIYLFVVYSTGCFVLSTKGFKISFQKVVEKKEEKQKGRKPSSGTRPKPNSLSFPSLSRPGLTRGLAAGGPAARLPPSLLSLANRYLHFQTLTNRPHLAAASFFLSPGAVVETDSFSHRDGNPPCNSGIWRVGRPTDLS